MSKKAFIVEDGKVNVVINPHLNVDHPIGEVLTDEFNKTSKRHKNFFYVTEKSAVEAKEHAEKLISEELYDIKQNIYRGVVDREALEERIRKNELERVSIEVEKDKLLNKKIFELEEKINHLNRILLIVGSLTGLIALVLYFY